MQHEKNAESIVRSTLSLYGEVLALGRDWVEPESWADRSRVGPPPERPAQLEERPVEGLRPLTRRRGRWEILGRLELVEALPYRGTKLKEALEGLAALTRREP